MGKYKSPFMKVVISYFAMFLSIAVEGQTFKLLPAEDGIGLYITYGSQIISGEQELLEKKNDLFVADKKVEKHVTSIAGAGNGQGLFPQIAASSATYNAAIFWGDYVMLDTVYKVGKKEVPWRTDFECSSDTMSSCAITSKPINQLWELSYYMIKNGFARKVGVPNCKKDAIKRKLSLPKPQSELEASYIGGSSKKGSMSWEICLSPLKTSILKTSQGWTDQGGNSTKITIALIEMFNKASASDNELVKDSLGRTRAFTYSLEDQFEQKAALLLNAEIIFDIISKWGGVQVIGSLPIGEDRGIVYVKPIAQAQKSGANEAFSQAGKRDSDTEAEGQDLPVYPFEYVVNNGTYIVEPGVNLDFESTLAIHTYLLTAIGQ